jgi:pimeloyl-ACP methyl ester carboxylesterase
VTPAVRGRHLRGRPVRTLELGTVRPGVPEVVIVPGLGALGYLLPTVRACSTWTRVHLLDLPGFGHRQTARSPSTLAHISELTAAWLRAVAGGPVVLLGHSTGAQAALRAAVDVPDRIALLSLAGVTFPPAARRWRPLIGRVARTIPHEPVRLIPATLPEYLRSRGRVATVLRTAMADEPERLVARVGSPVLVIRGAEDAVCDDLWARRLAELARDGSYVAAPGAHNFNFERPELLCEPLRTAVAG